MVVLKGKAATTASSPLSIAPKSEASLQKEALSFSQLLQGFATLAKTIQSEKSAQNGALQEKNSTLTLASEASQSQTKSKEKVSKTQEKELQFPLTSTKKETPTTLAQLMQVASEAVAPKSEISFNPHVTAKLTSQEIKTLIHEAKEYLKTKILGSDGFKNAEIASLPKTLKGLVQVAQKLGLEPSKITLEEVQRAPSGTLKESGTQNIVAQKDVEQKKETPTTVVTSRSASKKETPTTDATLQSASKKELTDKKTSIVQTQVQTAQEQKNEQIEQKFVEQKTKETPLFKAQTATEISTQEMVNAKNVAFEMKKPKEKGEDNLKLLLRGESRQKGDAGVATEISAVSAKVIAPHSTQAQTPTQTHSTQNLESFLQGKSEQESSSVTKLESAPHLKAESVEVKINEAKQMVRYLSGDIRAAIEDYKSPFTRIKVQLNPQRLGEIDLTVVQRGKNLHVTLTSNNAAINALAMNTNDLKLQLTNNGIQNATLNFSSNGQSQDGSAFGQQSSQQRRQEAHKEYAHSQSEEAHEEILSSLEIVVPSYA